MARPGPGCPAGRAFRACPTRSWCALTAARPDPGQRRRRHRLRHHPHHPRRRQRRQHRDPDRIVRGLPANAAGQFRPPAGAGRQRPPAAGRRVGNLSLRGLRNDGVEPRAIVACMAGPQQAARRSAGVGRPGGEFELSTSRRRASMPAACWRSTGGCWAAGFRRRCRPVAGRCHRSFWLAVRGQLDLLKEARGWWDVVAGTIVPPVVEGERDCADRAVRCCPRTMGQRGVEQLDRGAGTGHGRTGMRC